MLLLPNFFLRSTTRLLFIQTLLAWLCMRIDYIPLSTPLSFVLKTTLGTAVNSAKDVLDSNLGFTTPWEATFFFPMLLDEYIITRIPELAILLGDSPCSHKIVKRDDATGMCTEGLAFACFEHGAQVEGDKSRWHVLRACYEEFRVSDGQAKKHQDQCHKARGSSDYTGPLACLRVKTHLEQSQEVCRALPPYVECAVRYSGNMDPLLHAFGINITAPGLEMICPRPGGSQTWNITWSKIHTKQHDSTS